MFVNEVAKRVGRHTDTIKRWADEGLLECERDERNRRIFREEDVERCRELARLSVRAQMENRKLADLAEQLPKQLGLMERAS